MESFIKIMPHTINGHNWTTKKYKKQTYVLSCEPKVKLFEYLRLLAYFL